MALAARRGRARQRPRARAEGPGRVGHVHRGAAGFRPQRAPQWHGRSGRVHVDPGAAAGGPEQQLARHHAARSRQRHDGASRAIRWSSSTGRSRFATRSTGRAELTDFEQQIKKRQADEVAAKASDDSTLSRPQSTLERARLELVKNEMLPKIAGREEHARLRGSRRRKLKQLQETYESQARGRRRRHQDPRDPPRSRPKRT